MRKNDFQILLQSNSAKGSLSELEGMLNTFPYSQNIRQLYLKALYENEHYKFEGELKKAAVYSNNRRQLKTFITGVSGKNRYITYLSGKVEEVEEIKNEEVHKLLVEPVNRIPELESTIVSEVINAAISVEVEPEVKPSPIEEKAQENVAVEKLTFVEWLKKTRERSELQQQERSDFKKKAEALIEDFINKQPKIVPKREFYSPLNMAKKSVEENDELATETLAKIYTQQGNYAKAIKTYETLILKFPEKMALFAAEINRIKNLPKK